MPSSRLPGVLAFALGALSCLVLALIAAAYWPWLDRALALEDSPVVWWQTSLLLCSAVVTLLQFALTRRRRWLLLSGGLVFAALDERFLGHERLKEWFLFEVFDGDATRMGWLGDAPMILYAAGAAAAFVLLWRESSAAVRGLLALTVVAAFAAISLDIAYDSIGPQIVEEVFEVSAETFFACAVMST